MEDNHIDRPSSRFYNGIINGGYSLYLEAFFICLFLSAGYTILVTGCSGRGKSTFCNFLFKDKRFATQNPGKSGVVGWGGSMSSTSKVQYGTFEDKKTGVELTIIDTPGYLATHLRTGENQDDTSEDDEMVLREFSGALMYAREGIDAIFITLKASDRVSLEEQFLMNFIDSLHLWKHCMLLFTHGSLVGENDEVRYLDFHRQIKKEAFQKNCPVLVKMLEKTKKRFVIVESVNHDRDVEYYDSKLDEICKAVDTVLDDVGVAFNHPMLELARNAHDMHRNLKREEEEKIRVTKKLQKDLNSKEAELEGMRQSLAQAEQDRQRTKQLVDRLESHIEQRPNADQDGPVRHLVNYLKRLDDDPDKVVDMYSHMEMMVKEQRRAISQNDAEQVPHIEIKNGIQRIEDVEGQAPRRRRRKCSIL